MPDWEAIVRRHLAGLVLAPEERSEVIEELAAHLEETCAEFCEQGVSEEAGVRLVLSQVTDWQDLRRRIQIARTKEKIMTNRVTQFWVPALVTLFLAMVLLPIIQMIGPKPWMPASEGHLRMTPVAGVYVSWLLTLPPDWCDGSLSIKSGRRLTACGLQFYRFSCPALSVVFRGRPTFDLDLR
jgi:hypothetical protein